MQIQLGRCQRRLFLPESRTVRPHWVRLRPAPSPFPPSQALQQLHQLQGQHYRLYRFLSRESLLYNLHSPRTFGAHIGESRILLKGKAPLFLSFFISKSLSPLILTPSHPSFLFNFFSNLIILSSQLVTLRTRQFPF